MKKILASLITFYCLLFTVQHVRAQNVGLSISPPVVEVLISPNKKLTQAFTIRNQGESGDFVANIHSVKPDGDQGHVIVDPLPLGPSSIPLLVSLANADLKLGQPFHLDQNASAQLVLSIEGASSDTIIDTYLGLVVEPMPGAMPNGSTLATTTTGISSLILATLTPDGTQPINLAVENFEPPLLHDTVHSLTISPILSNTSPVMIRIAGSYSIWTPDGKKIAEIPLYNNLILKDSKRIIQGINQAGDPIALTWQPKITHIGPYRLRLTIATLGGTTIQEVEKTLWLLPTRTLIILLLAIFTTTMLVILKKRRVNEQ